MSRAAAASSPAPGRIRAGSATPTAAPAPGGRRGPVMAATLSALALGLLLAGLPAAADTVVPTRTLPAQTVIGPEDVAVKPGTVPGAVEDPARLIGMETRVALYAGRPVRPADVGFPAVVERNQIVTLIFSTAGLHIATDGRALERAGPGDMIRVMNLSSRSTVRARMGADGAAYVSQ